MAWICLRIQNTESLEYKTQNGCSLRLTIPKLLNSGTAKDKWFQNRQF